MVLGPAPPAGAHGFYDDTQPDLRNPSCVQRIAFTDPVTGAERLFESQRRLRF